MAEDKVVLHFEVRDDGSLRVLNQAGQELGKLERQTAAASGSIGKSLSSLGESAASLGGAFNVGAGAAAAALIGLGKQAIDRADDFNTLSERTGVAVETLAGLKGVAIENDVSLDTLARGMQRLSREMGKGNEAFDALGVKVRDAQNQYRDVADVFQDTVAKLSLMPLAERNAKAAELFGRSYMEMSGVLRLHASELEAQMERGREAIGVTTEQGQAADNLKEQFAYLKESVISLGGAIIDPLVPSLARGTSALSEFASTAARALRDVMSMGPIDAVGDWVNRGLETGRQWREQENRKFGAYGMTSASGASSLGDVPGVDAASIYYGEYSQYPTGAATGPPTSAMIAAKTGSRRGGGGGRGGGGYSAERDAARELARLAKEEEESIKRSAAAYREARDIRHDTAMEAARAAMESAKSDEEKLRAFAAQQDIERESLQIEMHRLDLALRFAEASELTAGEQEKLRAQIESARAHLDAMPQQAARFREELEASRRTVYDLSDELESGVQRAVDGILTGGKGGFKLSDVLKGTGQAMASGFISALIAAELRKSEFDAKVTENMTVKLPGIFSAGSVMIEDAWGGLMSSLTSSTAGATSGIGQMFSSLFGSAASGASSLGSVFSGALGGLGRLFGGGSGAAAEVVGMTGAEGATVAVPAAGSGAAAASAGWLPWVATAGGALAAGNALWSGFNAASSTRNRLLSLEDIRRGRYTPDADVRDAFGDAAMGSIPLVGGLLQSVGLDFNSSAAAGLGSLVGGTLAGGPIGFAVQKIGKLFGVDIVGKVLDVLGIRGKTKGDQRSDYYQHTLQDAGVSLGLGDLEKVQWYRTPNPKMNLGRDTQILAGNPALESIRDPLTAGLALVLGPMEREGGLANVLVNNARYMNKTMADTLADVDKVIQHYGLNWANMLEQLNADTTAAHFYDSMEGIAFMLGRDLPKGVDAVSIAMDHLDASTDRVKINIADFNKHLEASTEIFGQLADSVKSGANATVQSILSGQGPGTSLQGQSVAAIQQTFASLLTDQFTRSSEFTRIQAAQAGITAAQGRDARALATKELSAAIEAGNQWLSTHAAPMMQTLTAINARFGVGAQAAEGVAASTFDNVAAGRSFADLASGLRSDASGLRFSLMSKARQRAMLYSRLDTVDTKIRGLEVGGITPDEVPVLQSLLAERGGIGQSIAGFGGRKNTLAGAGILESTASIAERWARVLDPHPQIAATNNNTDATNANTAATQDLVAAIVRHAAVIARQGSSGGNHAASALVSDPKTRASIRRVVMAR